MALPDRKVILLAVDNPDDVALIRRTLRSNDIANDIVHARDGVEALGILVRFACTRTSNRAHHPAAVVLDLKLPKVDGVEVLRQLRADARTRELPVLILSSDSEIRKHICGEALDDVPNLLLAADFAQFREAVRRLGTALRAESPAPATFTRARAQ